MTWNIHNYWPDIGEIGIDNEAVDSSFETETELKLELYLGECELNFETQRVFVGFCRVVFQVDCHGVEIAVGERYGDNVPTNDVETTHTKLESDRIDGKANANVTINPKTLLSGELVSAGLEGGIEKATQNEAKTVRTEISKNVVAKGNGKWEFCSIDRSTPLDAKYLTSDMTLCKIKPTFNANLVTLSGHLYAHKNDIVIRSPDQSDSKFPLFGAKNVNKEKVFKRLLGKSINTKEDLNTDNYVQISFLDSFDENAE